MYFEKAGVENTDECLKIAFEEAEKRGIGHIVIASTWGHTAAKALGYLKNKNLNIVIVTHNAGFKEPGVIEFPADIRETVEKAGAKVLTGTMATRTIGKAVREKSGFCDSDIACAAWRMLGQGTKVCIEIVSMACDAGLIPCTDVIAVSGTGKGADTAMVVHAYPSNMMFDLKIREYLTKPKNW